MIGPVMKILIAAAAVLALAAPAAAQTIADSFGGFSQHNNNQPIDIEADSLEVLDDQKYAVFKGNVKARQGKFELVAKRIRVTYQGGLGQQQQKKKGQASAIESIEASGKVAISTADGQSATSEIARFDVASRIVTISGNVILTQSGNVMQGDKLVIDLKTGRSRFDAKAKTTASGKVKKRITGVFMPGKIKDRKLLGGGRSSSGGKAPAASGQMPPLPAQR